LSSQSRSRVQKTNENFMERQKCQKGKYTWNIGCVECYYT